MQESVLIDENYLLEELADKASKAEFVSELPIQIQNEDYYQNGSPFKLFFVDDLGNDFLELKSRFGYVYITLKNLDKEWKCFYSEREDLKMAVVDDDKFPPIQHLKNWSSAELFKHPLNSIIIFDKFILSNKHNQKIDTNIKPLLNKLLYFYPKDTTVDIMIIAEYDKVADINKDMNNKLKAIQENIRKSIRSQYNDIKLNVSIVKYDTKNQFAEEFVEEYDRFILTNYFFITSGSGFNLFTHEGKPNHRTRIEFDFVFLPSNSYYVNNAIQNLNIYLALPTVDCYPNKQNRLLSIS
jgi:hypothetical protein